MHTFGVVFKDWANKFDYDFVIAVCSRFDGEIDMNCGLSLA